MSQPPCLVSVISKRKSAQQKLEEAIFILLDMRFSCSAYHCAAVCPPPTAISNFIDSVHWIDHKYIRSAGP